MDTACQNHEHHITSSETIRTVVVDEAGLDDLALGTLGVDLADETLPAIDRGDTDDLTPVEACQ